MNSWTVSHFWFPTAVYFAGPGSRPRSVLSLGVFLPNTGLNSACNLHADAEFVDSMTLLAPQWGSAVHFGGPNIRARIALQFGAAAIDLGGPTTRLRIVFPHGAVGTHTYDHMPRIDVYT